MTGRLRRIYDLIPKTGTGVIDVGTDHGLIPTALAVDGYEGRLLATDLRPGPLQTARRTVAEAGIPDGRIQFLLCDGLGHCRPEDADTVVIAGMGGETICGILDRAEWILGGTVRLILQPMTQAAVVRYWLVNNGFVIEQEAPVAEGNRVYQILTAVAGPYERYTDAEILLGKPERGQDRNVYRKLAVSERARLRKRADGFSASEDIISSEKAFTENILREIELMIDFTQEI